VATDYWQAYPAVIPADLHLATKAEPIPLKEKMHRFGIAWPVSNGKPSATQNPGKWLL
jgi:hypothetical protein